MTTHKPAVSSDPRWLGAARLLPFFGLAALSRLPGAPQALVTPAPLGYGAVIPSFVGALHRGLAMAVSSPGPTLTTRLYVWRLGPVLPAVATLNPGYREGLALSVRGCLAPPPTALPELDAPQPSYSRWLKRQRRHNPGLW